jgi:hypothetical protein
MASHEMAISDSAYVRLPHQRNNPAPANIAPIIRMT